MRLIDLEIINENLGNLQKLQVGPLINVLKQHGRAAGRNDVYTSPVGNKFSDRTIGPHSEIIDVGVIKNGIKGLRKAYRDNARSDGSPEGFAVYIGGKAVMFGTFTGETLAGASRHQRLAYDFSQYKDQWDQTFKTMWDKPQTTTIRQVEPYGFVKRDAERAGKVAKPYQYAGNILPTSELSKIFDAVELISKDTGQPVTAKLVMRDIESAQTRIDRYRQSDIDKGVEELSIRLAKFKLAKKPTVDTIEDFIKYAMDNPGKIVQFAGRTYKADPESYTTGFTPKSLISGTPFDVHYSCADPGVYGNELRITYAFDRKTQQLKPISAEWSDNRGDPSTQRAVLDGPMYLRWNQGFKDISDKQVIIPKLLRMVKVENYRDAMDIITALRKSGEDWPELAMIEKSLSAIGKD